MQDEINEKTIALYIKTGKLTAQTLQKAMKTLLAQMKKQKDKTPQGKQTLKQLMKQNAGVSNIEITEGNIKAFESTAKKYGIDFALKKDTTESPPRYLVFFKTPLTVSPLLLGCSVIDEAGTFSVRTILSPSVSLS